MAPALHGVGGLRRARRRAPPTRARVPQHRPPDRDGVPGRPGDVPADVDGGERRRVRPLAAGDGAAWQRQFEGFMANADLSFGVLGTELWSTGRARARRGGCSAASAAAACSSSPVTRSRRAATGRRRRSPPTEAHGLLAPWVLHTGLGPENAVSGFMTQVIACAVQLGGMPVPVGGGVRLVEALAGIVRDAGGELRTSAEVERITVSGGRAAGVVLADGETIGATRAVIAGVTPTQLYGRAPPPRATCPPDVRAAARALPLRPRGDADPPRARRAAALEGAGRGAARPHGDRPRDARASTASRVR